MIPQNQFYPWALQLATQRSLLQPWAQHAESFATRPLVKKDDIFATTRWDDMRQGAQTGMAIVNGLVCPVRRGGQWLLGAQPMDPNQPPGVTVRNVGLIPYTGLAAASVLGARLGVSAQRSCTAAAAIMLYVPVEMVRTLVEACCLSTMGVGAALGAIITTIHHLVSGPRSIVPKALPRPGPRDNSVQCEGTDTHLGVGHSDPLACKTWERKVLGDTQLGILAAPWSLPSYRRLHDAAVEVRKLLTSQRDKGASLVTGIVHTANADSHLCGVLMDKRRIHIFREAAGPACVLVNKYGDVHRVISDAPQEFVTARVKYLMVLSPVVAQALQDSEISDRFLRNTEDSPDKLAGQFAKVARARNLTANDYDVTATVVKVDETFDNDDD